MLIRFILFGCFGLLVELTYSAIKESLRSKSLVLTGEASIVLFPFYGFIAFFFPLFAHHVGMYEWWIRGLIYMVVFFASQYLTGWILDKVNLCPWNYPRAYSLHGLIYFPQAPLWFVLGLFIEWAYPWIKALSEIG